MTYYLIVPTATGRRPAVPRGRGRPPSGEPVLTRAALLEAAACAFAQGYAGASVRAIARELGVSQAAVQHHAPTKQDLLFAVIDEVLAPRLGASGGVAGSIAAAPEDPVDRIRRLVRDRVEALAAHGGIVLAVLADRSPGAAARRERLLATMAGPRAAALTSLGALGRSGAIRPVSVQTWTMLSIAAIPAIAQALPLLGQIDPGLAADRERVLDEVADLFVLGLVPR